MADFSSDNCAPAHPDILRAMESVNTNLVASYGADDATRRAKSALNTMFEAEPLIAFTATGTAANALALSLFTPPYGAILCHEHAHIRVDEYGAPGFFSGGAQMIGIEGACGRLCAADVSRAIVRLKETNTRPFILSLTQPTESGTLYRPDEIHALCAVAKEHGLRVHMDGARLANALCALECTPAELTWRAGVDVLTFGGTKNGCLMAEAVIVFSAREQASEALALRARQAGQVLSKMRYLSAQWEAYLPRWKFLATHANAMARRLGEEAGTLGYAPLHPVEANSVFLALPPAVCERLRALGHQFFDWHDASVRLVTSWATPEADVRAFLDDLRAITAAA